MPVPWPSAGRGVYNVVDDDPAPVAEWLPALAPMLGAKQPMRMPRLIARLLTGQLQIAGGDMSDAAEGFQRMSLR